MSTNGPTGGKTTASRPDEVQIVHGVCHDCAEYEDLYEAERAADALEAAIEDAIGHARATGHTNVDHELVTEPGVPTCGRCHEPVHGRITDGPSATDQSNQPCGCTPTGVSE